MPAIEREQKDRYQDLSDALHARESSTTLIATVASSASVILLAIYNVQNEQFVLDSLGFLFPILGEIYRELTITKVDAFDLAEREAIFVESKWRKDEKWKDKSYKGLRRGAIRFLLLIPSPVWVYVLWRDLSGVGKKSLGLGNEICFLAVGSLVLILIVLWLNHNEEKKRDEARKLVKELAQQYSGEKPTTT